MKRCLVVLFFTMTITTFASQPQESLLMLLPNDCKLQVCSHMISSKSMLIDCEQDYRNMNSLASVNKSCYKLVKSVYENLDKKSDLKLLYSYALVDRLKDCDQTLRHEMIKRCLEDFKENDDYTRRGYGLGLLARVYRLDAIVENPQDFNNPLEFNHQDIQKCVPYIDPHCAITPIQTSANRESLALAAQVLAIKMNSADHPPKTFVFWAMPAEKELHLIVFQGAGTPLGIPL